MFLVEAATSPSIGFIMLATAPVLVSTLILHGVGGIRLYTACCVVFRLPGRKIWKRARPQFLKLGLPYHATALQYLTYT